MQAILGRSLRAAAGGVVVVGVLRVVEERAREAAARRLQIDSQFDAQSAGASAARSLEEHGMAMLLGVLSLDSPTHLAEVDAGSMAAAAGIAVVSMLPTVHQADAWVRQAWGAQLGERAAATAMAQQEPTLFGCLQAVAQLAPHASSRWLALPPSRVLTLHEADTSMDALDEALARVNDSVATVSAAARLASSADAFDGSSSTAGSDSPVCGGVSPTATRLRAWAGVLLAPALQWATLLADSRTGEEAPPVVEQGGRQGASASSAARGLELHSVRLLVPDPPAPDNERGGGGADVASQLGGALRAASWPRLSPSHGVVVLLPLPSAPAPLGEEPPPDGSQPSGTRVDVLLPPSEARAHRMPVLRLLVPAGAALALDGAARWRLVDDGQGQGQGGASALVLFEYREPSPQSPNAIVLAAARMGEEASVALRAALALALPPNDPNRPSG